jgi:5-methylcytosine-specific restriction protein A
MVRDKYRCQPCQLDGRVTLAVEVDHIVPQAEGGDDGESNLQAICGDCHEVKTRAEAARGVSRSRFGARPRGAKPTTPGGRGEISEAMSPDTVCPAVLLHRQFEKFSF